MKGIIITLLAATVVATACTDNAGRTRLQESNDSLRAVILEKDVALTNIIGTINVVEEGFKKINEMQGRINLDNATSEVSHADALQRNIEYITNTLTKNKAEIDKLKKQLSGSQTAQKELKKMLAALEQQLKEKSAELVQLNNALAEKNIYINKLDSIITELTNVNTDREMQLIAQEQELNSVWYAIGSKKELKNQKILSGGDLMRESDINMGYFTKSDKRELRTIDTYAKRAKLLSNHPDGSYTLERDANKQYVLTITAPDLFWSATRYLVIQTR